MLENLNDNMHTKFEEVDGSRACAPGVERSISSRLSSTSDMRDVNEPAGFSSALSKLGRLFARTVVVTDPTKISLMQENRVDMYTDFIQFVDKPSNNADVTRHIKLMDKNKVRSTSEQRIYPSWVNTNAHARRATHRLSQSSLLCAEKHAQKCTQ